LLAIGLAATALGGWLWFRAREDAEDEVAMPLTQMAGVVPAADFTLTGVDGRQLRLSDLRGQVVLLNFWATWCPPCRAELPDLEAIYREDGVSHSLTVVGVDVEENAGLTQAFAKQYDVTFPLLPDPDGKVSDHLYAVRALPTSFLIDRAGNVRYTWVGEETRADIESRLARLW
jgi:peroxiredoxin